MRRTDWPGSGGRLQAPTRSNEDEDEEGWPGAGGRLQAPTRGQYPLGVGGSRSRSPRPKHPRPSNVEEILLIHNL